MQVYDINCFPAFNIQFNFVNIRNWSSNEHPLSWIGKGAKKPLLKYAVIFKFRDVKSNGVSCSFHLHV